MILRFGPFLMIFSIDNCDVPRFSGTRRVTAPCISPEAVVSRCAASVKESLLMIRCNTLTPFQNWRAILLMPILCLLRRTSLLLADFVAEVGDGKSEVIFSIS
jgi:hypothetical protein